ncbi:DNA-directed DNA polymerase II small subunit [Thermococcus thioreducens]|uniref:DNA polymerase II small subunit n=1 Tax=Thermococcus thioreducens TaxID=277988 RepID=A0A0Q2M671_9EURY|nr:DNA-directed DNA polymerase II small subunit [Thermococcus thioreducens]ASJ11382.1 DNA polymerase II [Thermococcus thioreducens]KQH83402.1 DNA polymerase II [Thermococcus thioreducens]SEW07647.1 DNA polymerase II small subunit [Thermococcus thioreducens]
MGLIEDLMANNYLITPSAYYLLVDAYKRDFTLAELIKFAKAKGTFMIDSALAKEFLSQKGVSPMESPTESPSQGGPSLEEYILPDSTPSVEISEESPSSSKSAESASSRAETAEKVLSSGEDFRTSISTGTASESGNETYEIPESGENDGSFSGGESFISTGDVETAGAGGDFESETGVTKSPLSGASDESLPVESEAVVEEALPENGNGYNNGYVNVDENGNGVKPKVVYGDYGVPIAYVGDEVPEEEKSYSVYSDFKISPVEGFHYRAKEISDDYEVVFDVKNVKFALPKAKNAAGKEGDIIIKVYSDYFRSRLRKMRRILRENPEIGGVIDIAKLGYVRGEDEVTIIGLVNSKKETARGFMFEVEDNTGVIKVFINRNNEESQKFFQIMPDAVVAFRGRYSGRGIFFANRIYLPDVPKFKREKPPLEEKVYAVLLSDIHVGSNKFCEKAFMRFLEWLNGDVNNRAEEEFVSRIKYMIIAGDVVDGIGIYPGQYNELAIPDIFDQYEALANLLSNVPQHITMFIGPGNHDAARTALPQPGFYEEYARPLLELKNAVIISNPAVIRLHGRDFLIAHGRGIEDVVTALPNRSHHRPAEAMLDLLKLRHLAPTFGEKVPIAPDSEDTLVIESVPDLFQAGHVHVMQYKIYNGVFLINTGTWQAQTEFQKMVNIVPTPARVPIIDIETARLRAVIRFDQYCEGV